MNNQAILINCFRLIRIGCVSLYRDALRSQRMWLISHLPSQENVIKSQTSLLKIMFSYRNPIFVLLLSTFLGSLSIMSSHAFTYNIDPTYTNMRFTIDHFNTPNNTDGFYNSDEIQ